MIFTWLVILLLVGVNALYVAAEFAAVSARRSRIHHLASSGNALAIRLLPILKDARKLDQYIAASQVGITLSSLILGAYGQVRLAAYLEPRLEHWGALSGLEAGSISIAIVLIGLTVLQVVLGELVPKSLALQYTTQTALYTVLPMRWSLILFSWFIAVLNGSAALVLRLVGIGQTFHRHIHSPEEIDLLLVESRDGGLLEPDEQQRLHKALKLSLQPVHQIMVPRRQIAAIDIDTPVDQILREVAEGPYTRLPVYRKSLDNIIGMLDTKDLVTHFIEQGSNVSIEQIMRNVPFVPESITVDRLLTVFRNELSHQAIVMDEYGGTEGLVTLEDVLTELLGDVSDEFKQEEMRPDLLADGRVRIPGAMSLNDAELWMGIRWQGEAHTVAGRVIEELGHLPTNGESTSIDGVRVEVERTDGNAITALIVTPVRCEEDSDE